MFRDITFVFFVVVDVAELLCFGVICCVPIGH